MAVLGCSDFIDKLSRAEWNGMTLVKIRHLGSWNKLRRFRRMRKKLSPISCPQIVRSSARKPRLCKKLFYPPLAAKDSIGDLLGRKDVRSCFGQTTPKRWYLCRPIVHQRQPGTPGTAALCRVWAPGNRESRPASSLTSTDHCVLAGPQRLLPRPPNLNTRMRSVPRQKRPPGAQSPIPY